MLKLSAYKQKSLLEEQVQELTEAHVNITKTDGKAYCPDIRMMVYDAIVDQAPTVNIPHMIEQFTWRCDITLTDVPHRSTVESMTRKLGLISDLQAAEAIMANKNTTLGFDATTQEGQHVNSSHVTPENSCYAVAVDELREEQHRTTVPTFAIQLKTLQVCMLTFMTLTRKKARN